VLCGLAPALHASVGSINADLGETSGRGSEGRRTGRTRDALVALEIAVALVLLVGAGLLLRSFHSLSRVDTGIRTERLLTFDMALTNERARSPQSRQAFYERALGAIAALPGVESAGAAATLPIGGDDFASGVIIEGKPEPRPGEVPRAGLQVVTPGYFRTMGIRVVDGRDVADSDTADAMPVVLVNETFARQHWPGEPAVGRRIRLGGAGNWFTVVGVVSDIRHLGPATPSRPEFYQPYAQRSFASMAFVVRTSGFPTALVPSIRSAVTTLDRAQPISGVSTMEEHIARALSRPRFMSTLIGCFGFLALVLSTVGVYGVMAFSVAQRTREIAIRTALGATGRDVLALVLGKAILLAAPQASPPRWHFRVCCGVCSTASALPIRGRTPPSWEYSPPWLYWPPRCRRGGRRGFRGRWCSASHVQRATCNVLRCYVFERAGCHVKAVRATF
jgi:putative ABC transport system permease protein